MWEVNVAPTDSERRLFSTMAVFLDPYRRACHGSFRLNVFHVVPSMVVALLRPWFCYVFVSVRPLRRGSSLGEPADMII